MARRQQFYTAPARLLRTRLLPFRSPGKQAWAGAGAGGANPEGGWSARSWTDAEAFQRWGAGARKAGRPLGRGGAEDEGEHAAAATALRPGRGESLICLLAWHGRGLTRNLELGRRLVVSSLLQRRGWRGHRGLAKNSIPRPVLGKICLKSLIRIYMKLGPLSHSNFFKQLL